MRLSIVTLIFTSAVLYGARAHAQGQPWLDDRRLGEGIGIRAGDFELHPGVAGEVGFDSNFFQGSGRQTPQGGVVLIPTDYQPLTATGDRYGQNGVFSEPTTGAFRFRLTPSLTLKSLGSARMDGEEDTSRVVNLQATASASYNELLATNEQYRDALSQQRYVSGDVAVEADILPSRPWGVILAGQYNRSVQPVNDPSAPPGFDRSTFRAGSALRWQPGGGLMRWTLGYRMSYVLFEEEVFSEYTSIEHAAQLNGTWKFLPRTSLLYSGEYSYLTYPDGGNVKVAGSPLKSEVGINGLITDHFAVLAKAGWKALFFEAQDDFDSAVGTLQLTWYPLPRPDLAPDEAAIGLSSIQLGYNRDARPAYLGNYVQTDSVDAKGSYFFAGKVLMTAEAGYQRLSRPAAYFENQARQNAAFSENRANARLFLEYRTSDSFGVNATLRYSGALTDRRIPLESQPADDPLAYDDISFNRFETWLGARWFL